MTYHHIQRYNSLRFLADLVVDHSSEQYLRNGVQVPESCHRLPKHVSAGIRIFVKTDLLKTLLPYLSSVSHPFHLLTGSSDLQGCPDANFARDLKHSTKICSWAGTNLPEFEAWMLSVPIGLEEHGRELSKPELTSFDCRPMYERDIHIFCPYFSNTHPTRQVDLSTIRSMRSPEIKVCNSFLPPSEYKRFLSKSTYTVCLRGNGIDTIRIYESLLSGSIPIVLKSPLWHMHREVGCTILNDLEELLSLPSSVTDPNDLRKKSYKFLTEIPERITNHQVRFFRKI